VSEDNNLRRSGPFLSFDAQQQKRSARQALSFGAKNKKGARTTFSVQENTTSHNGAPNITKNANQPNTRLHEQYNTHHHSAASTPDTINANNQKELHTNKKHDSSVHDHRQVKFHP
jgi:hypothetical protein